MTYTVSTHRNKLLRAYSKLTPQTQFAHIWTIAAKLEPGATQFLVLQRNFSFRGLKSSWFNMVEGKMQIFRPDRSEPIVGISWFCVKPNLKINIPCVNQKFPLILDIQPSNLHPNLAWHLTYPYCLPSTSYLERWGNYSYFTGPTFLRTCKEIGVHPEIDNQKCTNLVRFSS